MTSAAITGEKPSESIGGALLRVDELVGGYGSVNVLKKVSVELWAGEVVAVLGPNGAGKTTLLRLITGLIPSTSGRISFNHVDITKLSADRIVRQGLVMVPEGREIFGPLTVTENLMLGAYTRSGHARALIQEDLDRVYELFPILRERGRQKAGTLSGGQQQMLAIGRALMARPKLLLLDEPSLGISPKLTAEIFQTLRALNAQGLPMIVIEQNVSQALQISDRTYVMRTGEVAIAGPSIELRARKDLDRYYLGG